MLIRSISAILILIGFAGFFLDLWLGPLTKNSNTIEWPLADITDVAISDEGDVFLALMFVGRVQVYSNDGQFLRGFDVPTAGGHLCIEIQNDSLLVDAARLEKVVKLDLLGNPVDEEGLPKTRPYPSTCKLENGVERIEQTFSKVMVQFNGYASPLEIQRRIWHYLFPDHLCPGFLEWLVFLCGLNGAGVFSKVSGKCLGLKADLGASAPRKIQFQT